MSQITVLHFSLIAGVLVTAMLIGHLLRQRRSPAATLGWIIFMVSAPWLAVPVYLTLGTRKLTAFALPALCPLPAEADTPLARLLASAGVPAPRPGNQVSLHRDGDVAWDELVALVDSSTHTLDVALFLLRDDSCGSRFMEKLAARAKAGVRVRLLIDGIGSFLLARRSLHRLREAGVETSWFIPLLHRPLRGRTNLRNHRKLVIADGCRTWTGGRNLAAEYFVGDPSPLWRKKPWVDLSFDFSGALARQTQQRFDLDWAFATGKPRGDTPPAGTWADVAGGSRTQLIASGPDQQDDTLYALLVSSCFAARTRILAISPYFVPDAVLLMALTLAARRQVQVDLVLPRHSNHRLADLARHAAMRELTAAGGRVWLVPGMVHAKAVVIDGNLALAGSANLDERSLFLNYELMVAFFDPAEVARFTQWIERHRASAELYRGKRPGLARALVEGLVRWVAFQL